MRHQVIVTILCCFISGVLLSNDRISKSDWEKVTKKHDYTENYKEFDKDKEKEKNPPLLIKPRKQSNLSSTVMMLPLIVLGILLLVLLVLFINGSWGVSMSRNISNTNQIEEIDDPDQFTKSDLQKHLEVAINAKDFRLAIRIQFLMLIKALQDKELISWRKEKTNFDYFNELSKQEYKDSFRYIIRVFEKVWYANYTVNLNLYSNVATKFEELKQRIEE